MDEIFEGDHPSKSIGSLPESIQSLLGFKTYLTPSWVESVCCIIKDLPCPNLGGDPLMKSPTFEKIELEIDESPLMIQGDLASLNARLNQLNLERRQALNEYLDLKGNIRVFCRIRPFLGDERCSYLRPIITADSSNVFLKIAQNKNKQYSFDKVFHQQSTQEEVFSEIEPVIKSAMDGYNVCIFAYGQTGTGKTYTMEGRPDCPGVVTCGIEALFEQALQSSYRFQFTFSMLEIYTGSLRDLLVPQSTKRRIHKAPCLPIQMAPDGGIEIENLVSVKVSDSEQMRRLYKLGSRFRSTASTKSNSTSSRSHCLIRVSLTCFNAPERRRETNKIWMVDLGGSERLLKTQATGRRLEEGKAINLSLSALGDVISALQSKKPHVPYRNSKLTQVLRDSLGSDSKTLMLVHVSPKEEDMCETVCSLGFATRVRSIHLGSEEPTEVRAKKEIAMAELLQKVKYFEGERQDVKRDIERLNGRLKHLTGSEPLSDENLEASYLCTEWKQSNGENNVHNVRDSTGASTSLPRFMRPTICSQRKTGTNHQTSVSTRKKPPVPSQMKRSSSVYAESVTFPSKGVIWQSDLGSECSIPTTSYANSKYSADDGTECSQGTSEYEIKKVIFPGQEKSPRSMTTSLSHGSANESEDDHARKINQKKNLATNNWLHLQMKEQISLYTRQSKRVLAIPIDRKSMGTVSKEHVNDFRKEHNLYGAVEQFGEAIITGKSHKNMAEDEAQSFSASSSSDTTDCKYHQNTDSDQSDQRIKLIPEDQRACIKITKEIGVGSESSVTESGTPVPKENSTSVYSYIEKLSGYQQCKEDAEETRLLSTRSQRSLFTAKDIPTLDQRIAALEDSAITFNNFQEKKHDIGTKQVFRQLWASILLGLGIRSLGFEHDFFHGLMF